MTQAHIPPRPPARPSLFRLLLRFLTRAPDWVPEFLRRRIRTLAALLVALAALAVAGTVLVTFGHRDPPAVRLYYFAIIGVTAVVLIVAWLRNRSGRHMAAARLTVYTIAIGSWAVVATDPAVPSPDPWPLNFTLVAVMLSSFLLPTRATITLAVAQLALTFITFVSRAPVAPFNWPSMITFHVYVIVLSVLANYMMRKDMEQLHAQTQDLEQTTDRLKDEARRDPLTHLHNRRDLEATLWRQMARVQRSGSPLAVMMIDVDNLKLVNDNHGHEAGDYVLRDFARFLTRHARATDFTCRYGGDEFVVLLPETGPAVAAERAARLVEEYSLIRVSYQGGMLPPSALSIGISSFPQHATAADVLIRKADEALYLAKRAGGKRVAVAPEDG